MREYSLYLNTSYRNASSSKSAPTACGYRQSYAIHQTDAEPKISSYDMSRARRKPEQRICPCKAPFLGDTSLDRVVIFVIVDSTCHLCFLPFFPSLSLPELASAASHNSLRLPRTSEGLIPYLRKFAMERCDHLHEMHARYLFLVIPHFA